MQSDSTEFNIRPNAGFSHRSWYWLMLMLVLVSMTIALRFAWLGFWMILPFTIIELTLVMVLMQLVRRRGNYVEKIVVNAEALEVFHLQKNKNQDWSFPVHWARVDLKKPNHRWYPHRLCLGSSGNWVEVGACLTDEERLTLADAILQAINTYITPRRTTHA